MISILSNLFCMLREWGCTDRAPVHASHESKLVEWTVRVNGFMTGLTTALLSPPKNVACCVRYESTNAKGHPPSLTTTCRRTCPHLLRAS